MFLLGYPFSMPKHEELVRRVAGEHQVPFVSMVGSFTAQQAGASRSDWFVDSIHCTARGYELMARIAAERLGDELR